MSVESLGFDSQFMGDRVVGSLRLRRRISAGERLFFRVGAVPGAD
jgi:hypothetical protein